MSYFSQTAMHNRENLAANIYSILLQIMFSYNKAETEIKTII